LRKHLPIICWFLILAVLGAVTPCAAAEPKTVALIPFKVNAEKDMTFLRDGIYDMLGTRLAREGEVQVLPRRKVEQALAAAGAPDAMTEAAARDLGRSLAADYVLFGSLTVLGNSASIDTKMLDVAGSRSTLSFFDQSEDLGGVITKINLIAADINAQLFGQPQTARKAPPPTPAGAAAETEEEAPPDIHQHPEKLFKSGEMGDAGESILERAEGQVLQQDFWKSARFKYLINGLSMGDVTGDGLIETVIVTPDQVLVYRSEKKRFYKVIESQTYGQKYIAGVDVADINGNGKAEIFVTSLTLDHSWVESFVLEFDGQALQSIVDGQPWFYRVAELQHRGKILLGQEHRRGQPFSGALYEMQWENAGYSPGVRIKVDGRFNLLGLTMGDVTNTGAENVLAYDPLDHLQLFEPSGAELWKDSDNLGGTTLYYNGYRQTPADPENRIYLPMRLLIYESPGGENRVLAVKNEDVADRKLDFRHYSKAVIISYTWKGLDLASNWKTRRLSGAIRDFGVADFDNDGVLEIVAAVVQSEGTVVTTSPKSTLIAYDLAAITQ
jgi:TolB-like protein